MSMIKILHTTFIFDHPSYIVLIIFNIQRYFPKPTNSHCSNLLYIYSEHAVLSQESSPAL